MRIFAILIVFSIVFVGLSDFGPKQSLAAEKEFTELRSHHFIIHYEQGVKTAYATKIKNMAENFYRTITQDFHLIRDKLWLWDNRAKIFVAKDKESYKEKFKCSPWASACVNYYDKIIYTFAGQAGFKATLAHELTHIIFHEYVGKGRLPLWLDEGVATYMGFKHGGVRYNYSILREKLRSGEYIKLADLNKVTGSDLERGDKDYVNLFYLESLSLVNFIMRKSGKYRFSNFLDALKKGQSVNDALAKVFISYRSLDELEARWKKFYLG